MINNSIDILRQQYALQQQSSAVTDEQTKAFQDTVATAQDLRDKIANFDDFFRPLRNYFYWEPHCFDIPVCCGAAVALRRARRHRPADRPIGQRRGSIAKLDALQPKLLALIPPQIASPADQPRPDADELRHHLGHQRPERGGAAERHRPGPGVRRVEEPTTPSTCRRRRSPTPNSSAGLKLFLSPDGKAARMIITHDGDPATPEGISHIDAIRTRGAGGRQGHAAGGCQDLHRRHCGHLQGHPGRRQIRPA